MRICIITIHSIHNFGSVLQAYSLSKYLSACGHEVTVIDYRPHYFRRSGLRSTLGSILNFGAYQRRRRKYDDFVAKNIPLSSIRYSSIEALRDMPPHADVFMAGGDQLWNSYHPCGRDDAYKLSFALGPKMSYGTSLGRDNYSRQELLDISHALKDFRCIGIRERSSVDLLRSVGVTNVSHVVDPVLLLEPQEYDRFISDPPIRDYLFVYLVTPSAVLERAVKYISNQLGLKVVLSAGFSQKCSCDVLVKDMGPEEALGYIKNASFVLSASYHATLFSIIFGKRFATLLPGENTNARITDFLDGVNLSGRIVEDTDAIDLGLLSEIPYPEVHGILDSQVSRSKVYLRDAVRTITAQDCPH